MFRKGDAVVTTAEGTSRFGPLAGVVAADQQPGANTVLVRVGTEAHLYHEVCWEKKE